MDTKIIDPNDIAPAAADNSDIKNTIVLYDDNEAPTPIFTINPTYEEEPDDEHDYIDDYDE